MHIFFSHVIKADLNKHHSIPTLNCYKPTHKQRHNAFNGHIFIVWYICKNIWGRVITPLWCLEALVWPLSNGF